MKAERDKSTVIAEIKAIVKKISDLADEIPDCGGLQGAAVMEAHPELVKQLERLSAEGERLGIKPEDLQ